MGSRLLSRRQLLTRFWKPPADARHAVMPAPNATASQPKRVVIQGRYCLAYRSLTCSTCVERCPEPEAMELTDGVPRINPAVCTGCGICHEVCPAPTNAILLLPIAPGTRAS